MKVLAIFVLALFLSGCSGPLYLLLYNNSQAEVAVQTCASLVTLPPGREQTFEVCGYRVMISVKGRHLTYGSLGVPGSYYEHYKFPYYRVHAQLESDLSILVFRPGSTMPQPAGDQPEGFPRVPQEEPVQPVVEADGHATEQ